MSAKEAKPKPETDTESVAESEVKESDVIMAKKREGGGEVRRRGRRPKAKEGEMPATTATAAEPARITDVQQFANMLVKNEKMLDRIENRLKPIKGIEKESNMIKLLNRQIKDLSKQVSRLEKSINRLKTAGKGRRGKIRGRKAKR